MDQYLVFQPVTVDELNKIDDRRRSKISKSARLTHCADIETLIVKVSTAEQEKVIACFAVWLLLKCTPRMGLEPDLDPLGSTTFTETSTSNSKEANGSWNPVTLRPRRLDWPTLVLEVGLSESLPRLRNDARWWLSNSGGCVNVVLILHINLRTKIISIEKWELPATGGLVTRLNQQPPAQIPTQMQAITIDRNNETPLTLHFHKIFLRQPAQQAEPPEHDLVFTAEDLQGWADAIWPVRL